jgi:FkbM family methyltransferase
MELADFDAIREVFATQVYDFSLLPPSFCPHLVIDCGSHIGCFLLFSSLKFSEAKFIAFEPDSSNFQLLQKNLSAQTNPPPRGKQYNAALSNYHGVCHFSGPSSMGGRLAQATPNDETVEVVRLSDHVKIAPEEDTLLKIDVEGEEWNLLEDIADFLPKRVVLFLETHHGDEDSFRVNQLASTHSLIAIKTNDKPQEACAEWLLYSSDLEEPK